MSPRTLIKQALAPNAARSSGAALLFAGWWVFEIFTALGPDGLGR